MITPEAKRHEYWNHFLAQAATGEVALPYGVTKTKLRKIKFAIIADVHFWSDVVLRHNGQAVTPEEMARDKPEVYDHCRGNFWGMVAVHSAY